jgi:hypothetical protein
MNSVFDWSVNQWRDDLRKNPDPLKLFGIGATLPSSCQRGGLDRA